jgi:hypothetical protein
MFTLSLIITALLSVLTTYYAPQVKRAYIAQKTRKNQKLQALIRSEVEKQLKEILNDN